jgi:hypothetical protein
LPLYDRVASYRADLYRYTARPVRSRDGAFRRQYKTNG